MQIKAESSKGLCFRLLEEMKTGMFAQCDKLPRETELSELLGISRTQLRDALSELDREGFITRRHGVGTVINRHVLDVQNRMDIETEFLDIIRQMGCEPSVSFIDVTEDAADENAARKLQVEPGTPVVRIRLVCDADGRPAIYCDDVFEKRLVKREYRDCDFQVIIFQFLERFCDVEAYMDLTELHPVVADEVLARILKVEVGTPLLNMEEIDYDIDGNPLFYSRQFFVDGAIKHTVMRKKI